MSDTYTPGQIAARLSNPHAAQPVAEDRVRKVIRQECDAQMPDELRMIPGGRYDMKVMFVYAGIFDAITSGRAVTRTAPASPSFTHPLIRKIDQVAS